MVTVRRAVPLRALRVLRTAPGDLRRMQTDWWSKCGLLVAPCADGTHSARFAAVGPAGSAGSPDRVPELELTTRQRQILSRLLEGDRVPTIAAFLCNQSKHSPEPPGDNLLEVGHPLSIRAASHRARPQQRPSATRKTPPRVTIPMTVSRPVGEILCGPHLPDR